VLNLVLFVRARHTWDLDKIDQVSDDLGRVLVDVAEQPFAPDGFRSDHSDISSWCLEVAAKSEVQGQTLAACRARSRCGAWRGPQRSEDTRRRGERSESS
jgi:hypothetical protein